MSKKLMMNNIIENGGDNMQIQRGTVTASTGGQNTTITVNGLNFIPNILIVKIVSDISTGARSLAWIYTDNLGFVLRTDSSGVSAGINSEASMAYYNDNGYVKGTRNLKLIENGFTFYSVSHYGPIQAGDIFEWIAIKYE